MGTPTEASSAVVSTPVLEARIFTEADVPRALSFLEVRPDACFLLNNLETKGIVDNSEAYQGTYSGIWCGDTCQGVFAHCWNGMLLVSFEADLSKSIIGTAAKLSLSESPKGRMLAGLLGTPDAVNSTLRVLGLEKRKARHSSRETMLRCAINDLLQFEAKGQVRRACIEEVEDVTDMQVGLEVEALSNPNVDRAATKETVRHSIVETKDRWVLESEGSLVSTCRSIAKVRSIIMVGGVYTPKDQRCKRYARTVVAGMLKAVAQEEEQITTALLFSDTAAALHAYRAIGFKDCGFYMLHFFEDCVAAPTLI